ncbi:MAG TPA: energy transducer TonB [Candidatus Krumholzibacteria bacterium]|nr:energy transducer TonB [Candidatus Krumholzibacteria bacterium]HPD70704.1 energy transducer TonB [Candidatus Krumholzibacteria bacterium]HRY39596.1 energy transducer TonB [Candidatus Krumholzibacteria bacterium]
MKLERWFLPAAVLAAVAAGFVPVDLAAGDPAPPATGAEAPRPADPGKADMAVPPRLVEYVAPEYPEAARRDGIEGAVLIRLLIDADGAIVTAEVARGVSENVELEAAALAAAKQCVFAAGSVNGRPVRMWAQLPIVFELD